VKQRGRKSDRFNVIEGDFAGTRPEPPDDLTPRQRELWTVVANDEPITHFSTAATKQLLRDYCFHREWVERISGQMAEFPPDGLKSEKGRKLFRDLSKTLDMHTRGAASLATKLRLTNQSRYTPMAAATASRNTLKGQKPWEI